MGKIPILPLQCAVQMKSVQVAGLGVKKELQISLEQLKTNFKKHEVTQEQNLSHCFFKDCSCHPMWRKPKEGDEGCKATERP